MREPGLAEILDLVLDHGAGLTWAIAKAVLAWGAIGLVVAIAIYAAAARAGTLAVPGAARWPRLTMAAVLALVTWPSLIGFGVTGALRDEAAATVRGVVATSEATTEIGAVLVTPMVVAHLVIEGADMEVALSTRGDVSFLRDVDARRAAAAALTDTLVARAAREAGVPDDGTAGWIARYAIAAVSGELRAQLDRYLALFSRLDAGPDGILGVDEASRQVGEAFIDREVVPAVTGPFDTARLVALAVALGAPALVLIATSLVRRRRPPADRPRA